MYCQRPFSVGWIELLCGLAWFVSQSLSLSSQSNQSVCTTWQDVLERLPGRRPKQGEDITISKHDRARNIGFDFDLLPEAQQAFFAECGAWEEGPKAQREAHSQGQPSSEPVLIQYMYLCTVYYYANRGLMAFRGEAQMLYILHGLTPYYCTRFLSFCIPVNPRWLTCSLEEARRRMITTGAQILSPHILQFPS